MLDDRKSAILRAVVKEYIETGEPVGSTHLARAAHLGVSPATVRNEMAVLEREGFLSQPHTSAGRVPSDKGYRFYVDQLRRPPAPLTPAQTHQVREFFARAHGELEQMLHETSDLLSGLTDYAAMVVASPHNGATVRSVHLVGLAPRTALVVAVLSSGVVEKATIEVDPDTGADRVATASAQLAAHLTDRVLEDVSTVPDTGDAATDRVVRAAHEALREHCDRMAEHVFVGGASRMAATFDAVESVRHVLALLEQQYVVVGLLRAALTDHEGLNVAIGAEHGVESLADCSLVVAPYLAGGAPAGTIAVLGPTRMKYPQAMAVVNAVSQRLGRLLTEG